MQGRKPKPTALKLIQGNPGKRPLNIDEFKPCVEIPKCPTHLKGVARKEYHRITAELVQYGLISNVDRAAITFYCTNWARYIEAEEMIEKAAAAAGGSGLFMKAPSGYPIQSPWLAVSNKSMELCRVFLAEFGMSPASRSRIVPSDNYPYLPGLEPVKTTGAAPSKISSLADFAAPKQ